MVLGLSESPETYARRTERLKRSCELLSKQALDALQRDDLDWYILATKRANETAEILLAHLRGRRPVA